MLILQILDRGRTFYEPIGRDRLTIGRAPSCDVRLTEGGVADVHAQIEPIAGDPDGFKIVDLGAEEGTRVNGELVVQRRVELGDRIEVGRAVLVVGKRVARRATAADVLEPKPVAALASRARKARPQSAPRRGSRALLAALVVVAVAAIWQLSQSQDSLPIGWAEVDVLTRATKFDEAHARIDAFRHDWAAGDERRNARLDAKAAEIDAFAAELRAGIARVRRDAETHTFLEQFEELQQVRESEPGTASAAIAEILLSDLTDLRLDVARRLAEANAEQTAPEVGARPSVATGDPAAAADPPQVAQVEPRSRQEASPETASESGTFVQDQLAAIAEHRRAGRFAIAFELLRETLPTVAEQDAGPLNEALAELRAEAEREMRGLIDRLRDQVSTGRIEDVDRALAALDDDTRRFPTSGVFTALIEEREDLARYRERLASRPPELAPERVAGQLADLRERLAEIRRADRDGRFGEASRALRTLAERVRARDPMFAASLDGRAVDFELLAAMAAHVAEHRDEFSFVGREGGAIPAGQAVDWSEIGGESLAAGFLKADVPPPVLAGAAVAAYRNGDVSVAERLLARVVQQDDSQLAIASGVIERGRGATPEPDGYRLVKGRFVAVRAIRAQRRAEELTRELGRVVRRGADAREKWLEGVLALGPAELDALVFALRTQVDEAAGRLAKDEFKRHYDKVAAQRAELDRARAYAEELIFDEQRYFYPYRPPAVSAARASEYGEVQHEVDERVAAVRALWNANGPSRRVPQRIADQLERIDWVAEVLRGFGETIPGFADRIGWARSLKTGEPLGLKTFCRDERERRQRDHYDDVREYNRRVFADLSAAEIAQVRITNDYREMFGHRPLAVNPKIYAAARGHAEEMARLGYFSHFSPVPGRRTPHDRMRLADYPSGISENIARHQSAATAHYGWIHSSGHHRNLLHASHTEFAVGNAGGIWVQNFGRGEGYLDDPRFPK